MSTDPPRHGASLTQGAFDRLLSLFDRDRERAGEMYEKLRRKLVQYFEIRGSLQPEDLADRTIDRVSGKVEEGEQIRLLDPTAYFCAVARNILHEHWNERKRDLSALRSVPHGPAMADPAEISPAGTAADELERSLGCLERCLAGLSSESRDLIVDYYRGHRNVKIENRRALAARLGIPLNALRLRSLRLRTRLEVCVRLCLARGDSDSDVPPHRERPNRER